MANNTSQIKSQDELALLPISDWNEDEKLRLVGSLYSFWQDKTQHVRQKWVDFTRLYMNQYKSTNNLLGSKVLFTQFNKVLATLRQESKEISFEQRNDGDKEIVDNLKQVREYDEKEMAWDRVSSDWDYYSAFYGLGALDLTNFSQTKGTLLPVVVNPFLFIYDVLATNRDSLRFAGKICYATSGELFKHFGEAKAKKAIRANRIQKKSNNRQQAQQAEQSKSYQTGLVNNEIDESNALSYYEIVDLHVSHLGEMYRLVTDASFTSLLLAEKVDFEDGEMDFKTGKKTSRMPFEFKSLFKSPNSIQGLGVPHIVEDDHRGDVQIINFMFEGTKKDATGRTLIKQDGLVNPKDLMYADVNKNIFTKDIPSNVAWAFPKTDVVNNATLSFSNMLTTRSNEALGTTQVSGVNKTATQSAIEKNATDILNADRIRDMVIADIGVWSTYVARLRKYLPENYKKIISIVGKNGESKVKSLSKIDFTPVTDPNVVIKSRLLTEPERQLAKNEILAVLPSLSQIAGPEGIKESVRNILRLGGMKEEKIDSMLPPTPDEYRAKSENNMINGGESPLLNEYDNDLEHLIIHSMAEDNEANERHKQGHILNYLRKTKEKAQVESQRVEQSQVTSPTSILTESAAQDVSADAMVEQALNEIQP